MSDNTSTMVKTNLKQVMLAINIGFDDNDEIKIELLSPEGFKEKEPEMWESMQKHAAEWYIDLMEYAEKVVQK